MKKHRIYEIAKELHVNNEIIIKILNEYNIKNKTYLSTITEDEYIRLKSFFLDNPDSYSIEKIEDAKPSILSKQPKLIKNDILKIKELTINSFRNFEKDSVIKINDNLTLIVGQNATSKSTVLGMIAQPFEFSAQWKMYTAAYNNIKKSSTKTLANKPFEADYSEVFRMSPKYDDPQTHTYIYYISLNSSNGSLTLPVAMQKRKDQKLNNIRFVTGQSRNAGEGNYPHPLIYLGLDRLYPLAKSKNFSGNEDIHLTVEETNFYNKWQQDITIIPDNISPDPIKTDTKDFLACKTYYYDGESNSAGQDNIGQIITAILSFKRLKTMLGDKYRGGILLIDEVDATLHIVAQERIIKFLVDMSITYNLQIICTTHSINIIELCSHQYNKHSTINALYRRKGKILVNNKANLEDIKAEITAISPNNKKFLVHVFFEDIVAMKFFNVITNNYFKDYIHCVNDKKDSFEASSLINLAKHSIPGLDRSIFILDGDMSENVKKNFPKKSNNILVLPVNGAIELVMYNYLHDENSAFWDNSIGSYNYTMCFKNYSNLHFHDCNDTDNRKKAISDYKKWFSEQESLKQWGINNKSLYKSWLKQNQQPVIDFATKFYEALIKKSPIRIPEDLLINFTKWVKE